MWLSVYHFYFLLDLADTTVRCVKHGKSTKAFTSTFAELTFSRSLPVPPPNELDPALPRTAIAGKAVRRRVRLEQERQVPYT